MFFFCFVGGIKKELTQINSRISHGPPVMPALADGRRILGRLALAAQLGLVGPLKVALGAGVKVLAAAVVDGGQDAVDVGETLFEGHVRAGRRLGVVVGA